MDLKDKKAPLLRSSELYHEKPTALRSCIYHAMTNVELSSKSADCSVWERGRIACRQYLRRGS